MCEIEGSMGRREAGFGVGGLRVYCVVVVLGLGCVVVGSAGRGRFFGVGL